MQVPEMQRHYAEWEITGAPEIRHVTWTGAEALNPFGLPAQARAIVALGLVGPMRHVPSFVRR